MANISDAFGTIVIVAEEDVAEKLARLIKTTQERVEYSTFIDYEKDISWYKTSEGYKFYFNGNGRWTYYDNAKWLYGWIRHDVYSEGREEFYKRNGVDVEEMRRIFEDIQGADWKIQFDFADAEGGCAVLYRQLCMLEHEKGKDECIFYDQEYKEYDYTAENLRELGFNYLAKELEREDD